MTGTGRTACLAWPLTGAALLAVAACTPGEFGINWSTKDDAVASAPPPAEERPAAAPAFVTAPAPAPAQPAPVEYPPPPVPRFKPAALIAVVDGDTVIGIAHRYGVAARTIIALNELDPPYWLRTGQRLRLPEEAFDIALRSEPPEDDVAWAEADTPPAETEAPERAVRVAAYSPAETGAPDRGDRAMVSQPEAEEPDREDGATAASFPETGAASRDEDGEHAVPSPPGAPRMRLARATPEQSSRLRYADEDVPLPPSRNTFLWPIEGRVISDFGSKPGGMHNDGINIAVPVGSEVRAAKGGVVAYAGNELRGYGNLVLIRHEDGWMTAYAHNDSLLVAKGDVVRRGQIISRSGESGRVSRPQAHFEIRRNGEPQDPLRLLTRK